MNKLFRFACVALLTGALVVACDDDEAVSPRDAGRAAYAYCSGAHLRNREWHGVRRGFWAVWSERQPVGRCFAVGIDGK